MQWLLYTIVTPYKSKHATAETVKSSMVSLFRTLISSIAAFKSYPGAPYQQAAIFPKSSVRLDTPPDHIRFLTASSDFHPLSSSPTPLPRKISCASCGSPFMDEGRNMIMAFPPLFEFPRGDGEAGVPESLQVQSHIFYGQRIADVVDGKDKWEGHKDQSNKMGDHD